VAVTSEPPAAPEPAAGPAPDDTRWPLPEEAATPDAGPGSSSAEAATAAETDADASVSDLAEQTPPQRRMFRGWPFIDPEPDLSARPRRARREVSSHPLRLQPEDSERAETVAAAVAVGSSSVHFTASHLSQGDLRTLADESVILNLGAVVDREGGIPAADRDVLVSVLERYARTADELGASHITFITTEPLRRAANAEDLFAEVLAKTGHPLIVVSHEQEALLSLLGVTRGRPPVRETLVVDIGGGSADFVLAGPGHAPIAGGIPTGALRLTAGAVDHDPPTAAEIAALRAEARRHLAPAPDAAPTEAIFVGGTAQNLVRIIPAAGLDRTLTRRRLGSAFATLQREPAEETATRFGISVARARILPGGAALVDAFLARYRLGRALVSEASIRDGVMLAVARAGAGWLDRLPEIALGWAGDGAVRAR
jgi:exopolyphosphatase/guanosine-5'-triphosphate,3'-diphosphate pyrophosphatase